MMCHRLFLSVLLIFAASCSQSSGDPSSAGKDVFAGDVAGNLAELAEDVGHDTAVMTPVTFEGKITNILTEASVAGATVTMGDVSATTAGDGTYSLSANGVGVTSFSVVAEGYFTRESAVSMEGRETINVGIIPQDEGFSLTFFDHVFRDGQKGTRRWLAQPMVEIWAQQLKCVDPCGTAGYEVSADAVPEHFETYAREAIAYMPDLSGGVMVNPIITMKSFPVGTKVSANESGNNIRFKYLKTFAPPYEMDGGATSGQATPQNFWSDAPISINGSSEPSSRDNAIYVHEFSHAMGWIPGHPQGVPAVPQASIMGPNPVVVTDADRLHAKILYNRPAGSLSPDRDPDGFVIN